MLFENLADMVGKTPILHIKNIENVNNLYAKLEGFNPAGSAKDRVAIGMILDAEQRGILKKGGVIIEPTSGNTGIGLAAFCAARGYRCILTMPESMSEERRRILKAYGAEIHLSSASEGMAGAISLADQINRNTENSIIAGQFENPANPKSHFETTGPEIWEDMNGKIDIFVAGIGTGGTVSGVGRYLKQQNADVMIVGVEPFSSPLITKGVAASHGIMGIGANFIPQNLDMNVIDKVVTVTDEDAYVYGRMMAQKEGILVGISSGAALKAATELAKKYPDKNVVVLMADTGERYLSTRMFE
ncbi:MAG: cysteine synthase A [Clostridia bacterium]|nr:cysteine synthase A [Clostridia bacterium]